MDLGPLTLELRLDRLLAHPPMDVDLVPGPERVRYGSQWVWVTWTWWPQRQVVDVSATLGGKVCSASLDVEEDHSGVAPRRFVLCPKHGCRNPRRLAVILVNRRDGWGCRRCLRIPHATKSASPKDRAALAAERVMRKLGAEDPAAFLRPPPKPKGMTWKRFWSLQQELTSHVVRWWSYAEASIAADVVRALELAGEEDDGQDRRHEEAGARLDDQQPFAVHEVEGPDRRPGAG